MTSHNNTGNPMDITVFKFGGTSLSKPEILTELHKRAFSHVETQKVIFVCSALKGVTRILMGLAENTPSKQERSKVLSELRDRHDDLINKIFFGKYLNIAKEELNKQIRSLESLLIKTPDYYASIVGYGEIMSTNLYSFFLEMNGHKHLKFEASEFIKTVENPKSRFSDINLHHSHRFIRQRMPEKLRNFDILLTYGFKAKHYPSNLDSILSLNGSDLSAGFFAEALDAKEFVLVKDTRGVLINPQGDIYDPANTITELNHKGYGKVFNGELEYPVYPSSIELVANKKIPIWICWEQDFEIGTRIVTE
jgi:aspartokinase